MKKLTILFLLPLCIGAHDFYNGVIQPRIDEYITQQDQATIKANIPHAASLINGVALASSAVNVTSAMRNSNRLKAAAGLPLIVSLLLGGVKEAQRVYDLNIKTQIHPKFDATSSFINSLALTTFAYQNLRHKPAFGAKVAAMAYAYGACQQINDAYKMYKKF